VMSGAVTASVGTVPGWGELPHGRRRDGVAILA